MWKEFLAETEVCEDNMTLRVQQNILQLNISIDDPQLQQTSEYIPITLQKRDMINFIILSVLWP
jgi:hypothetical protein